NEVSQSITIDQVTDELNRISQLDGILDSYFENNILNDLNNKLDYNEPEDLLEINITEAGSFIKKTEISYIINNPKSNISQESVNDEFKEKIFRNNRSYDIFLMLELRKSCEAFSHSDHPRRIRTHITVNLD
ncbi:1951_t:CDS:1, partial [Funneliformis geosporum]